MIIVYSLLTLIALLFGTHILWWRFKPGPRPHYSIQLLLTFHALGGARRKHLASLESRRIQFEKGQKLIEGKLPALPRIEEVKIPCGEKEILLRIYKPKDTSSGKIILYFFCGGFIIGSIDTGDSIARRLAKDTNSVVVSVSYLLAPDNPFPGAVDSGYAALKWINANKSLVSGKQKIFTAGDSSGGNLAATVALKARDEKNHSLAGQIIIYPCLDFTFTKDTYTMPGWKGYICTPMDMELFRTHYLPDQKEWKNPYASPLLAENLKNLPPALIITSECDILRAEALAYGEKLKAAGNKVSMYEEKGIMHGYMNGTGMFKNYVNRTMGVITEFLRVL